MDGCRIELIDILQFYRICTQQLRWVCSTLLHHRLSSGRKEFTCWQHLHCWHGNLKYFVLCLNSAFQDDSMDTEYFKFLSHAKFKFTVLVDKNVCLPLRLWATVKWAWFQIKCFCFVFLANTQYLLTTLQVASCTKNAMSIAYTHSEQLQVSIFTSAF